VAKLLIDIEDSLLSDLLPLAIAAGLSIDAFLCETARTALADDEIDIQLVDIDAVLGRAVEAVRTLPSGTKFSLPDLIGDETWKAIAAGPRKTLGKRFRRAITADDALANHLTRSSANLAIYQRL
jgi:hypothetical protein